jgi:tetratricopeptide (TPR) repeat protein
MSIKITKKTGILASVIIIVLIYVIAGFTKIDEGKVGFASPRLFGSGRVLEPGTSWVPPLLFEVSEMEKTGAEIESPDGFSVTDSKGNTVGVKYTFKFDIADAGKALKAFGSGDLKISVAETLEAEIKKQSAELCTVPEDYQFMAAAVMNELRAQAGKNGITPASLDVKPQIESSSQNNAIPSSNVADIITPYTLTDNTISKGGAVGESELLQAIEKEVGAFDKTQPPTYYNNRGSLFYSEGKYREAELEYKKFIILRPDSFIPFLNLYHVFRKQDKWEEAFFYIEEAMKRKLSEGDNFAYVMGMDFLKQNDIAKGRRMLELGVKYYPENYYLNLNLGTVLVNEKQFPEAVQRYLTALKAKPDSIQAMNNLAMLYYLMGNMRLATSYWKQSLDTNPNQPELIAFLKKVDEQIKKAMEKQAKGK